MVPKIFNIAPLWVTLLNGIELEIGGCTWNQALGPLRAQVGLEKMPCIFWPIKMEIGPIRFSQPLKNGLIHI